MGKPIAIDLFAGKGGWARGLSAVGWKVIGFDIEDKGHEGGELVLQDVLTLHGSQFRKAHLIVASPPCQNYSYLAMPWSRSKSENSQKAKAMRRRWETEGPDNRLFDACFRIQREAREAAGRYIPLVVENVKGAQEWVGPAKGRYGSFFLWGDVETVNGSLVAGKLGFGVPTLRGDGRKVNHHLNGNVPAGSGKTSWFFGNTKHELRDGVRTEDGFTNEGLKSVDPAYGTPGWFGPNGGTNVTCDENGYGIKQGGGWWHDPDSMTRRFSSRSAARREASARIAMIPQPLAEWIGRVYLP